MRGRAAHGAARLLPLGRRGVRGRAARGLGLGEHLEELAHLLVAVDA